MDDLFSKISKYLEESYPSFFKNYSFRFEDRYFCFFKMVSNTKEWKVLLLFSDKNNYQKKVDEIMIEVLRLENSSSKNFTSELLKRSDRRCGQTTRTIDEAVQYLFKNEQLFLLKKHVLRRRLHAIPENEIIFIDPDHMMSNRAQEDFIYRVMKRLESEHKASHKIKTISKDYIHVIVK